MSNIFPWQEPLWQRILQIRQRLPHAWILTGSAGIGKIEFAQYLAAWLLCKEENDYPCGKCRSCILQKTHQHPDYYQSVQNDLESDKTVFNMEMARSLKSKLSDSSQQGGARVVVIQSAESLSTSTANALLKVIEEPQPGVYFILTTDRPILIPVTLRSRCHLLHCPTPTSEQSLEWLKKETGASEESINKVLQWVSGAPLKALPLLHNVDYFNQREQMINEFLGLLSGKMSALNVASRWAALEEDDIFPLIDYVLHKALLLSYGVGGAQKSFTHVPPTKWFSLYEEMLMAKEQLWKIPGLNRQLFWENFLLHCEGI